MLDVEGLRPTSDRVRETLFNWLSPHLNDARCLDLFAGTGALGLEALSRGAREAVFIDADRRVVDTLTRTTHALCAGTQVHIECANALRWLNSTEITQPFDVVFIDPPYASGIVQKVLTQLGQGWLRRGALIYVETGLDTTLLGLPNCWSMERERKTGQVRYYLFSTS